MFPEMALFLLVLLYLLVPTFFFRTWVNVLFGESTFFRKTLFLDLTSKELLIYTSLILLMV